MFGKRWHQKEGRKRRGRGVNVGKRIAVYGDEGSEKSVWFIEITKEAAEDDGELRRPPRFRCSHARASLGGKSLSRLCTDNRARK